MFSASGLQLAGVWSLETLPWRHITSGASEGCSRQQERGYCVPGHCWMPVVRSCHVFCAACEAGSWDCQTGCSPQLGLFPQLLVGRCLDKHIIASPAWPHALSESTMGLSDAASRAIGPGWMVFWARFTYGSWFLQVLAVWFEPLHLCEPSLLCL